MNVTDRQTDRPRNSNIDRNRRNRLSAMSPSNSTPTKQLHYVVINCKGRQRIERRKSSCHWLPTRCLWCKRRAISVVWRTAQPPSGVDISVSVNRSVYVHVL